jgi:hypothetical protein
VVKWPWFEAIGEDLLNLLELEPEAACLAVQISVCFAQIGTYTHINGNRGKVLEMSIWFSNPWMIVSSAN